MQNKITILNAKNNSSNLKKKKDLQSGLAETYYLNNIGNIGI